ncbi:MAG TPA: ATP synthase F0 subunit B [Sphingobacteriaceae bacterium]|nr:ATP synthase F0 subunit B [Sphingobacteriaceae bacterium]
MFLLLVFLLGKFAWKPIMAMIAERELFIEDSLNKAEIARQEMALLTSENEQLLKQARAERDRILKEAKELKDQIVKDAKDVAKAEGVKMIDKARKEIESQKNAALAEIRTQVATLSIEIAEKVLRKQFQDNDKQEALVSELLKDLKLN